MSTACQHPPVLIRLSLAVACLVSIMVLACDKKSGGGPGTATTSSTTSDPLEAKKARLGTIVKELFTVMEQVEKNPALKQDEATQKKARQLMEEGQTLTNEMTGGDRSKEDALMDGIVKTYAPEHYEEVRKMMQQKNQGQVQAQLKNIQSALASYEMQTGKYSEDLNSLIRPAGNQLPYLMGGEAQLKDPWGNAIVYQVKTPGYVLKSCGPDGQEGTADDIELK